jgi:hypothetical protein
VSRARSASIRYGVFVINPPIDGEPLALAVADWIATDLGLRR